MFEVVQSRVVAATSAVVVVAAAVVAVTVDVAPDACAATPPVPVLHALARLRLVVDVATPPQTPLGSSTCCSFFVSVIVS